ncbi:AraC family transcriptional regulator [Vannielia litorea]|uniref:AraC family transcriptional regulator n=1 Tax=Vannielia litorea TaxID=1217970 RepID=UPI001BCBD009|nr:AraC family transcriptional regulator [Vannielia litorea]MBS8227374.1 AraC family transcriptional regulator [Vannielia litorea]
MAQKLAATALRACRILRRTCLILRNPPLRPVESRRLRCIFMRTMTGALPMDRRALIAALNDHADRAGVGNAPVQTGVPGLMLMRCRRPTELEPVVYQPVLCVVLEGVKEVWSHERPYAFRAGESSVVTFDLPTRARVLEAPYLSLALQIDVALLTELAAEMGAPGDERKDVVSKGVADAAMMDGLTRLYRLKDTPAAIGQLAPLIRRELHFWLLNSSHGPALAALSRRDSHAARIARATAEIRRSYTAPLRVAGLARLAGMSASTFHDHFKALTGTTPLQFQKRLRLVEARRLIEADGMGVSAAAFAVGYESPTQFSREFSRMFGVAPSRFKPEVASA